MADSLTTVALGTAPAPPTGTMGIRNFVAQSITDQNIYVLEPTSLTACQFRRSTDDGATYPTMNSGLNLSGAANGQFGMVCDSGGRLFAVEADGTNVTIHALNSPEGSPTAWDDSHDISTVVEFGFDLRAIRIGSDTYIALFVDGDALYIVKWDGTTLTTDASTTTGFTVATAASNNAPLIGVEFIHTGDGVTPAANPDIWCFYSQNTNEDPQRRKFTHSATATWTAETEATLTSSIGWIMRDGDNYTAHAIRYNATNDTVYIFGMFHESTRHECHVGANDLSTTTLETVFDTWAENDPEHDTAELMHGSCTLDTVTGDLYAVGRCNNDSISNHMEGLRVCTDQSNHTVERWLGDGTIDTDAQMSCVPYANYEYMVLIRASTTTWEMVKKPLPAQVPRMAEAVASSEAAPDASITVTLPVSRQVGDLLVLWAHSNSDLADASFNAITGWTFVGETGTTLTDVHLGLYHRRVDGTEGSTVTLSQTSRTGIVTGAIVQRWVWVDPDNPIVDGPDSHVGSAVATQIGFDPSMVLTDPNSVVLYAAAVRGQEMSTLLDKYGTVDNPQTYTMGGGMTTDPNASDRISILAAHNADAGLSTTGLTRYASWERYETSGTKTPSWDVRYYNNSGADASFASYVMALQPGDPYAVEYTPNGLYAGELVGT